MPLVSGLAWPVLAWSGFVWPGPAWSGFAWPAWLGLVWHDLAWPGCIAEPRSVPHQYTPQSRIGVKVWGGVNVGVADGCVLLAGHLSWTGWWCFVKLKQLGSIQLLTHMASTHSVVASYKPSMLVTGVRFPVCASGGELWPWKWWQGLAGTFFFWQPFLQSANGKPWEFVAWKTLNCRKLNRFLFQDSQISPVWPVLSIYECLGWRWENTQARCREQNTCRSNPNRCTVACVCGLSRIGPDPEPNTRKQINMPFGHTLTPIMCEKTPRRFSWSSQLRCGICFRKHLTSPHQLRLVALFCVFTLVVSSSLLHSMLFVCLRSLFCPSSPSCSPLLCCVFFRGKTEAKRITQTTTCIPAQGNTPWNAEIHLLKLRRGLCLKCICAWQLQQWHMPVLPPPPGCPFHNPIPPGCTPWFLPSATVAPKLLPYPSTGSLTQQHNYMKLNIAFADATCFSVEVHNQADETKWGIAGLANESKFTDADQRSSQLLKPSIIEQHKMSACLCTNNIVDCVEEHVCGKAAKGVQVCKNPRLSEVPGAQVCKTQAFSEVLGAQV